MLSCTIQVMLDDLFPGSDTSQLDSAVLQLSINILDDTPATDPRWAESKQAGGTGGPTSLIVLNQLRDKAAAHQLYINFLQQVPIENIISNLDLIVWLFLCISFQNFITQLIGKGSLACCVV